MFCSINELICLFEHGKVSVSICPDTELYWKRFFEYSCNERQLDMDEISYIVNGKINGTIGCEFINLKSGGLFWMSSNTPHTLTWPSGLIYYTLRFSLFCDGERIKLTQPLICREAIPQIETYLRKLIYVIKDDSSEYHNIRLNSLFLLLLSYIAQQEQCMSSGKKNRVFTDIEKQTLFSFCQSNSYSDINSDKLAEILGMSRDYFSRLFYETFGKSARVWLSEEKLRFSARKLLDSDISIEKLAEQLGYSDLYNYSKQFKKVIGMSPRNYRNYNRG